MINLDQILKEAIRSNASDIHLVMGKRPMLRISKSLNEMEDQDILQEDDMYEMYDYFVRGSLEKDEEYHTTRKIDFSYGFGGLIIYYVSSKIINSFLTGFVINFIFCGFIEYFISFFEEKIWNNRWWDYSNKFLNINGRICLLSLTFFGLMGSLLSLYAVNYIDKFYGFVNYVIVVNVFVLFVIDLLYSLYKPNVGEYISIYNSNN